jgi:hypothetical protein
MRTRLFTALALPLFIITSAAADQQQIAPGTGQQNSTVIDTGADGICNTTAGAAICSSPLSAAAARIATKFAAAPTRSSTPSRTGDDVQLIALGAACKNTNTAIIDTGDDGVADTTALGDDVQSIAVGVAPANQACVMTGADGVAQTTAPAGDDTQVLAAGARRGEHRRSSLRSESHRRLDRKQLRGGR